MRESIKHITLLAVFTLMLLASDLAVPPALAGNPAHTPALVSGATVLAAGNDGQGTKINVAPINSFFYGAYVAVRAIGAPIAILVAAFAGILILLGHRGGVEKLFYIAVGIIVILFAPTIINSFFK